MNHVNGSFTRSGFAPNDNWKRVLRLLMLMLSFFFCESGCVSDATLLQKNSSIALRSAEFQARKDLNCPQVQVFLVSEQEVPGAPWGYLYSDYRIHADGCGVSTVYQVECRDETLCDVIRAAR